MKINCLKCNHYYITWDRKFPKGCKLFGFKSAKMPSIAVFNSDGVPCRGFAEKSEKANKAGENP